MKKLSQQLTYWLGVVAVGRVIGISRQFVQAWTEPTVAPPAGNGGAPLNTSGTGQFKSGGLVINSGGAATGLVVDQGNVGIGTIAPSEKLEIIGGIKIGNTVNTAAGTMRWTGDDFEGYMGSDWVSLTGSGGSGGALDLVNGQHSSSQCTGLGGAVETDSGDKFCKFSRSGCPSGWFRYKNWSTTIPRHCVDSWDDASCTTQSHSWSNRATEFCIYGGSSSMGCWGYRCTATVTQLGCY